MFDVLKWEMAPWLSFINDKEGWLVAASGPALGTMYKSVYHTGDGGRTWQQPPLACPEVGGPFRYCDTFPPRFFGDKQLSVEVD